MAKHLGTILNRNCHLIEDMENNNNNNNNI